MAETEINWWERISKEDRQRLTTAPPRERCPWCRGITRHHPMCDELRASWSVMRWGKYKKKNVADVQTKYLAFMLERRFGNADDRRMFLEELQRRASKFRTPRWESCVEPEDEFGRTDRDN